MSWKRLEEIFARRLEDVLKMSWRRFCKTSWRRLEDVLKTSWRRLEDVWPRRIYWSWSRRLEDVLKTSSEDVWVRRIYSSWSRRLEDVFWRRRRKTPSERLHDVFIKTNVRWVIFDGKLYKQVDGVVMGSPLGSTLSNPFLVHLEKNWLQNCPSDFKL